MNRPRRLAALVLAGTGLSGVPVAMAPAPATAEIEGIDCYALDDQMTSDGPVEGTNPLFELLRLDIAHELASRDGSEPGEGVAVVLLDTGVEPAAGLPVQQVPPRPTARTPEVENAHGTIAAGLISGPDQPVAGADPVRIGIAPGADLVSVPVYDVPSSAAVSTSDTSEPDPDAVAAGLQWVLGNPALPERTVVLVPTAVGESAAVKDALAALEREGRLVVAPAGDRPASEEAANTALIDFVVPESGVRPPGEDAAGRLWPVAAPTVLGVGVIGEEEVPASVVLSSDVDVAAPILGAASYALNGSVCEVMQYSSELAAAVVAGVAALVWSEHKGDSPAELRSRLKRTADGNPLTPSKVTGYGVVQPVEALTRPVEPRADGEAAAPRRGDRVAERAEAPRQPADVLADTRRNAVWWGLAGGGALVIALVLRPVLARRRSR